MIRRDHIRGQSDVMSSSATSRIFYSEMVKQCFYCFLGGLLEMIGCLLQILVCRWRHGAIDHIQIASRLGDPNIRIAHGAGVSGVAWRNTIPSRSTSWLIELIEERFASKMQRRTGTICMGAPRSETIGQSVTGVNSPGRASSGTTTQRSQSLSGRLSPRARLPKRIIASAPVAWTSLSAAISIAGSISTSASVRKRIAHSHQGT
jgi:hypothetical protein